MVTPSRALLACLVILLAGCASEAKRSPEAVYQRSWKARRAGDVQEALRDAERGVAAWGSRTDTEWYWHFRLLKAELLSIQGANNDASALLATPPPDSVTRHDFIEARRLTDLGVLARKQDRKDEAADYLARALELCQRIGYAELIPEILKDRSTLNIVAGHYDAAVADAKAAADAAARTHDRYLEAASFGTMAFLMVQRYRYDEGLNWALRAVSISAAEKFGGIAAQVYVNAGWCYYRLGDFDKAFSYFTDAEKILDAMGDRETQEMALGNLGSLHYSRGEYGPAIDFYQKALAVSKGRGDAGDPAAWWINLAATYFAKGDLDKAEENNRQALDLGSTEQNASMRTWPVVNAARIAARRHNEARARELYDQALAADPKDPDLQWATRSYRAEMYFDTGNAARAAEETTAALEIVDKSWQRLSNDQWKLTFSTRLANFTSEYIDFLLAQNQPENALDFAESRRARLLAANLGIKTKVEEGGFPALSGRRHAVLLSYLVGKTRSYLWIASPAGVRKADLPGEPQIRALIEAYSAAIQARREPDLRSNQAARELWQTLVGPASDVLGANPRVIVSADGLLHELNFETLVTPAGHYWIEDATIEAVPSLRLLGQDRGGARGAKSILLIGDPKDSGSGLPPLPFAAGEIAGIADLFQTKHVLTGANATPEQYAKAGAGKYDVVHFAAHAVASKESPLDSAVVLSPGQDTYKLYARDVQRVPLHADLVTVSACQSAGARAYSGEGLVGFAWAFLGAGARNVIASLWDVNDQSTSGFMRALYQRIRDGQAPSDALRSVKLDFIGEKTARAKPYYWGAFEVYVR